MCAHVHSQRGKLSPKGTWIIGSFTEGGQELTQGYPEEVVTHRKWMKAHNPWKFHWVMSQPKGRVSYHRPVVLGRTVSQGVSGGGLFYSLVGSELWSFMVSHLEVSLS